MLLRAVKVQFQIIARNEIDSQYRKRITSTFKAFIPIEIQFLGSDATGWH